MKSRHTPELIGKDLYECTKCGKTSTSKTDFYDDCIPDTTETTKEKKKTNPFGHINSNLNDFL